MDTIAALRAELDLALAQHINSHAGEIAAIEGIQGLRGYPF